MEEIVSDLEKLGLTNRQARVLVALFQMGDVTAKELSRASGVHITKVYGALKQLKEKELVSKLEGEPALYEKVSPRSAVEKLLKQREMRTVSLRVELSKQVKVFELAEKEKKSELVPEWQGTE